MGWSIGYDTRWQRDIGYGVPAHCDQPDCGAEIDRGLAYVCGDAPYGGEHGCGLYFCTEHLLISEKAAQACARCVEARESFTPTPDVAEWLEWKLTDASWGRWRADNPDGVRDIASQLAALSNVSPA